MKFNWWTFLFEALNFVVLAYVLHRLLYHPLRDAIDKRQEDNARAQAEAKKARQEAEALQQQMRQQLASAEQQRQELIHNAHEQAEAERQRLLADAERTAQYRQEEARQAMDRDRAEALNSVHQEVITQAIKLTGRLLGEAADRTLHQQLALHLAETLQRMPEAERKLLEVGWQTGDGAELETAQDLDAPTLEQITSALAAVVGQPVALAVQRRPELLGGVRLRLGGHVWDGSLAGQVAFADTSAAKDRPS